MPASRGHLVEGHLVDRGGRQQPQADADELAAAVVAGAALRGRVAHVTSGTLR